MSTSLVTGGSGFIGTYCILQLLTAGYQVRTTVRNLKRDADVRVLLRQGGAEPGDRLSLVAADSKSWPDVVAGCEFVLHVASPLPATVPKDESEPIVPARDGALRVLRAARDAGVKRLVPTSSFASIGYGHKRQQAPFDETSWTERYGDVLPYVKSKTVAERVAWDFIAKEGGLESSVVNPVMVAGPVLSADYSASPAISCQYIARVLKRRMGAAAKRVLTRQLPNWLVRLAAFRDSAARQVLPELGKPRNATSEKAKRRVGWGPRSAEEAIVATAESLVRLGLLKDSAKTAA